MSTNRGEESREMKNTEWETDEIITPQAVSRLLNVPISWVYGKSHEGAFPPDVAFKVGAYLRFDRKALLTFIKKGGARR